MIIQSGVNRTVPDRIDVVVQNLDGVGSITTGYGATWLFNSTSVAAASVGLGVMLSDADIANGSEHFAGIAIQDIPIDGTGLIRCWGYAASVYISNEGSSVTINDGDPMVPGKAPGGMGSLAPAYADGGLKYVVAYNRPAAISAAGWMSGFVRCM